MALPLSQTQFRHGNNGDSYSTNGNDILSHYRLEDAFSDPQQLADSISFVNNVVLDADLLSHFPTNHPPPPQPFSQSFTLQLQPTSTFPDVPDLNLWGMAPEMAARNEELDNNEGAMNLIPLVMSPAKYASNFNNTTDDKDNDSPSQQGNPQKPYICGKGHCKDVQLVDRPGWKRHLREVHGPKTHYCHFTSCKRHTRGFSRQYNFFLHQKSCHGVRINHRPQRSSLSTPAEASNAGTGSETEVGSLENAVDGNRGQELERKLRQLKAIRAEVDNDIAAIERTLGLLTEDSS